MEGASRGDKAAGDTEEEEISVIFENVGVKCVKQIWTIMGSSDDESGDDDSSDDEPEVVAVLGVSGARGDSSEVEVIAASGESGARACDGEEEERPLKRPYSQVAAAAAAAPSTEEIIEEEIASTSSDSTLISSFEDMANWPPPEPFSDADSSSSSGVPSPSSGQNVQIETAGITEETDLEGNKVDEEIVPAAPLHEEEMPSGDEVHSEEIGATDEPPSADNLEEGQEKEATAEKVPPDVNQEPKKKTHHCRHGHPHRAKLVTKDVADLAWKRVEDEGMQLSPFDSQEEYEEFCSNFIRCHDEMDREVKEEKEAKEKAKLKRKEDRKKARERLQAEASLNKRTRLGNGVMDRKDYAENKKDAKPQRSQPPPPAPPPPPPPQPKVTKKPSKRKASEDTTGDALMDLASPAALCRPSTSRAGVQSRESRESPDDSEDDDDEEGHVEGDLWEVEAILDHRTRRNETEYKVRWKGKKWKDSWVSQKDLKADSLLSAFWSKYGARPRN